MPLLDTLVHLTNASQPLPWLVTSGQPTEAQLAQAQAAGVRAVIDLRDPMEPRPFDEPGAAANWLEYINIPVVSGAVSEEIMAKLVATLRAHADLPTLMHCASANRTSAPLIPYFMMYENMDEASAVDAAMRAGLRSAEMLQWGVEYGRKAVG